ncbi:hypothetical protein BDF19DRAFT_438276, partial [Syncephalis fuscata]
TLYITDQRLAWAVQNANSIKISIPFASIKAQLVNPATAKNIALRITLKAATDGATEENHSFIFPGGEAVAKREEFKEAIRLKLADLQGAPSTDNVGSNKRSASSGTGGNTQPARPSGNRLPEAIRLRVELLKHDIELQKVHRELVIAGHITEEEFWANKKHLVDNQRTRVNQQKGNASAWLDLRPVTEEGRDVKFTLTPQIIHAIFFQHPSEAIFWKRYFKSRFFHRNRAVANTVTENDDIFDKCLEQDETAVDQSKRRKIDELPILLDLAATEGDGHMVDRRPDWPMVPGRVESARSLIKRFNHHSEQIVKTLCNKGKHIPEDSNLAESITISDLNPLEAAPRLKLEIQDQDRYLKSQMSAVNGNQAKTAATPEDVKLFFKAFCQEKLSLQEAMLNSEDAKSVFNELNDAILQRRQENQRTRDHVDRISSQHLEELKSCQRTGIELLRHFWASIPSSSPQKRSKCERLVSSLATVEERARTALAKMETPTGDTQAIEQVRLRANL